MAKKPKPSKSNPGGRDQLEEPAVTGEPTPERGPSDRILRILKRLGAEQPTTYEDQDEFAPEPTATLSPSEEAERAKFRAKYGAYTKPGPSVF